jgi:hypothetical protein
MTFLYDADFVGARDMSRSAAKVIVHPPMFVEDNEEAIDAAVKAVEKTINAPILAAIEAAKKGSGSESKKTK